ncbi:MAG: DUF2273 domain-containing protein [Clostridia bacterium]|nr:DUF2273 domain-containing protein [Clostridia bacterium]
MDNFKVFCEKYGGAIIGLLVGIILAILLVCTDLYKFIIGIALIAACVYVGNYIQRNKESVKEKTKNFIDKL